MRELINNVVNAALHEAIVSGELPLAELPAAAVERPRDATHGDWATSVALRCAKQAGMNPRDFAALVAAHIADDELIDSVEIAGPGFINMRLSASALQNVLRDIRSQGRDFGRCNLGAGRKIQVEFVSANPTGPMHVGHGRWAALGDALSCVLEHAGWNVEREFYVNDAGSQMDNFAASVSVRYLQICRLVETHDLEYTAAAELLVEDTTLEPQDRKFAAELGENAYGGAYIVDIAREIFEDEGDSWASATEEKRENYFKERAYTQVLAHAREVLKRAGVNFDVWFSERTLHELDAQGSSDITRSIDTLREGGFIYEREGATWFASTRFGDDKDRVLIKADGDYTYFAADVAYHANKFSRGFDRVINILGADHHGYVPRMQAACAALGYEGQLNIIIGQLVNLLRDGVPVRLSKRAGTMVTFEELLDEVGTDATRYLMVSKSQDQPIDFDIEVAKKQDASNPVFYVQYAHARICSILRKAAGAEIDSDALASGGNFDMDKLAQGLIDKKADLSLLTDDSEFSLMRKLSEFGEIVEGAARDYAPYRLTHYAEDLAAAFHLFYTRCHVLTDDEQLTAARLYAVDASRIVLSLVLSLLGVSAPVAMWREGDEEVSQN